MDIFAPCFYKKFKCIADKCKHNCCIGWEIDVDRKTLEFYKQHDDIIKKIELQSTPHFILQNDDRCPFLNEDNLCEIILNHGEDKLCQICKDHPRFINSFDTRIEIGLGLTCEAAAKLILENDFYIEKINKNEEFSIANVEENDFFKYREQLLKKEVSEFKNHIPDITLNDLYKTFKEFERLENTWDTLLSTLENRQKKLSQTVIKDKKTANRLFCYFLFRYLHEYGLEFCVFCTYFILSIDYDIYETARMFSSEIEYSDENIEQIILKIL